MMTSVGAYMMTRSQKRAHQELEPEEPVESKESDSEEEFLPQKALKFLGDQFAYVKQYKRPSGALGRKWNIVLLNIRDELTGKFQRVKKLWGYLVAENQEKVRAKIISFAMKSYEERSDS